MNTFYYSPGVPHCWCLMTPAKDLSTAAARRTRDTAGSGHPHGAEERRQCWYNTPSPRHISIYYTTRVAPTCIETVRLSRNWARFRANLVKSREERVLQGGKIFDQYIFNFLCKSYNVEAKSFFQKFFPKGPPLDFMKLAKIISQDLTIFFDFRQFHSIKSKRGPLEKMFKKNWKFLRMAWNATIIEKCLQHFCCLKGPSPGIQICPESCPILT